MNAIRKLKLAELDTKPFKYVYDRLAVKIISAKEVGQGIIVGGDFNEHHIEQTDTSTPSNAMSSVLTRAGLFLASASPEEVTPPAYN